ncbi:hypothetical protein HN51_050228 [Arachis hypogaea]|uniref:Uncharacterized protein n=1 Tax=Arachis hypogaea TaxID=3818 RepID=A0A444YC77_ARAHY|nr:butyrate--CoA ligase AAE11, peroxisomal [Arachis ipaensis]XP_025668019.1 butyrate--CoA ligase AAE11, peroxisomal [Arachis hypogaea]QHN91931.1 Butyrate--CoA ligase AAE11, peroxisomal [Arachis hypogaea]RYQ99525.1 hypothetical protein Ahy_B07g087465 [Arachis hypogaea]
MNDLPKYEANSSALSPINFLKRASACYANQTSVIYEGTHFTWQQTYERCRRLASSLRAFNIAKNDVVSVVAPNIPAMYEMHFAVPMAGGVLNTINTRLDAHHIATILNHSEAKFFFVDYEYVSKAKEALQLLNNYAPKYFPLVILIQDTNLESNSPTKITKFGDDHYEYEQLIRKGDPNYVPIEIKDEWDPIALNYTSGTTSSPKGVVYTHRGTFLSTLSNILTWGMGTQPVLLWTLPMFHGNGWAFTWAVAARGGTNVCLRYTTAGNIFRNISDHHVTHMCCAPIVFSIILESKESERQQIKSPVQILAAGSPPPATLLHQIELIGFHVTHCYGLTESTAAALSCEWNHEWNKLPREEQARLKSFQGIGSLMLEDVDVKDLETMESVKRDGKTMGEIVLRSSGLMKGYLKDKQSTFQAFKNGWFHTGDVGVVHPNGYIQIKDRCKDIIISGGENISSIEVESVLYRHPKISEAAVVGMPHPRWGESPCAFVALKKVTDCGGVSEDEIIAYCRENLPHYMVPKMVKFVEELPKTSTGKVQKFELREIAKAFVESENNTNYKNNVLQAVSRL